METKEMKIQAPEGYEIDKEKSTFEKIIFKKDNKELPKTWEEVGVIKGWYTYAGGSIDYFSEGNSTNYADRNIFPTKEEAEACLVLAQLCQLRDRYNDGWKPDWKNSTETKHIIEINRNYIVKNFYNHTKRILAFKTKNIRDKFLENFKDLIEIAKPLL
nr:MAG TPA: hypothetical protein [Caudoviricetes sp.]